MRVTRPDINAVGNLDWCHSAWAFALRPRIVAYGDFGYLEDDGTGMPDSLCADLRANSNWAKIISLDDTLLSIEIARKWEPLVVVSSIERTDLARVGAHGNGDDRTVLR